MTRNLISLAVMAMLAAGASAQSTVTIYGAVDLGIVKGNGGTAPNTGANGTSEAWTEKPARANRLGFRGTEDLGGGLSAQFQLESRFTADDGAALTPFWNGRSIVQLSSVTLGRVYLGRDYAPTVWISVKTDPFGFDGVGTISGGQNAGFLSSESSSIRTSNTVGYWTPDFSGFTSNIAVSAGEGTTPRDVGFNVEYTKAALYVGLAYERQSGGPLPLLNGNSLFNVGLSYDFGDVKPLLYYSRSKTAGGTLQNSFFSIGGTAAIGPGVLKAVYGQMKPDQATVAAVGYVGAGNGVQNKFAVGYDYLLSKRTNAYLDVSTTSKAGTVRNVPGGTEFTNNNAFALGLRHTF